MSHSLGKLLGSVGRLVLPVAILAFTASLWSQETPRALNEEEQVVELVLQLNGEPKPKPPSEYWIGVACSPAADDLRESLRLGKGQALVIDQVLPDSPALKAGLMTGDVIIGIGETQLTSLQQLGEAVAASKGATLKLQLVRQGAGLAIDVQPAARAIGAPEAAPGERETQTLKRLHEQLDQLRKAQAAQAAQAAEANKRNPGPAGGAAGAPVPAPGSAAMPRVRVVAPKAPAQVPWAYVVNPPSLPDDMKISIQKQGKGPATIVVKQGVKLWKTTENELDMLPAEARAYAARLLGRPLAGAGGHGYYTPVPAPGPLVPGTRVHRLEGGGLQIERLERLETEGTPEQPRSR